METPGEPHTHGHARPSTHTPLHTPLHTPPREALTGPGLAPSPAHLLPRSWNRPSSLVSPPCWVFGSPNLAQCRGLCSSKDLPVPTALRLPGSAVQRPPTPQP
ncbi:hypothetical protein H1C71_032733 [Ictidomys tridecemlineatus]|nr:hypothetical protein H1C71_032733 [Ictidomys tridecemlineatus]